MRRHAGVLLMVALLGAACPASAATAQGTQAGVAFVPYRLGASTTVVISFRLGGARQATLSPLTSVEMRLPEGLSAGLNGLGLATCSAATLRLDGPGGCPVDALMGRGSATVGVPLGGETVTEQVAMTIVMAPAVQAHTTLLFYVSGATPVISQLVFQGSLLGGSPPFGAQLNTAIPLVTGLPGAPDVAVTGMRAEIGPKDLEYHKRVGGHTITYSPEGFGLPRSCPRAGFRFAATFKFANGAEESTSSNIPCPTG
jgi:hypothetical protein